MDVRGEIVLQAVIGSTAYGFANEQSDIDRAGVFVTKTRDLLGIFQPEETVVSVDPDVTFHEVGKFVRLAMKCNPTILEQLFLTEYETLLPAGQLLIDNRSKFLSKQVYKSYGGYAIDQARKLQQRGDTFSSRTRNRTSKHARHCLRLLQQGRQLLLTGEIVVRVSDPEEIIEFGELGIEEMVSRFEREFAEFEATETTLPDRPDDEGINQMLIDIRETFGR